MELWIEAFDTFGAATLMLSESFKGFFAFKPSADYENENPTSSPYLPVATSFAEIARKLNRTILPSVRQLFEVRCLQPIAAILAMIGPIDALLQERKSVLLDFDSYRAKIEKEHAAGRDSRHPLVIKKALKLDEVAKQLHSVNTTICASFEEFEKARSVTLGPEFSAFMACFFHFSSYSTELSGKVVPHLPQIASSLYVLESFIGQSFSDLYTLEGKAVAPATPAPAPSSNKFVKSSASTEAPSVVLERTEFAGGSYGGYASHSTVLPACYKDEAIEQMLVDASATAAAEAVEEAAAAEAATAVQAAAEADAKLAAEVPATSAPETELVVPTEAATAAAEAAPASAKSDDTSIITASAGSFSGHFGADSSEPSREFTPSGTFGSLPIDISTMPLTESAPGKLESALTPPPPETPPASPFTTAKQNAISEPPAAPPATPPAPPAKTGFFSSFFSTPAKAPLPVAQAVPPADTTPVTTTEEEEEEVPVVEATVRPPKPQKPVDLSPRSASVAINRSSSPVPLNFMSSPTSESETGAAVPNPAFRNTIAIARGSVEGNLYSELTDRKPLEASVQKPLKPPKPTRRTESNAEELEATTDSSSAAASVVASGENSPKDEESPAVAALEAEDETPDLS